MKSRKAVSQVRWDWLTLLPFLAVISMIGFGVMVVSAEAEKPSLLGIVAGILIMVINLVIVERITNNEPAGPR